MKRAKSSGAKSPAAPRVQSYDPPAASPPASITEAHYASFQRAYAWLNAQLFAGQLPQVLVTLQRKANSRGYFHPLNFQSRGTTAAAHELAMNPDTFGERTDREILSTLAHEMVHVWHQENGTPGSNGYHNREWAQKMKAIGLQPTSTGEAGGKETGHHVTHMIVPGAAFDTAAAELIASGFKLDWQSTGPGRNAKAKAASKTKYTCAECGANAWAKPFTALICGDCHPSDDEGIEMQPEE